MICNQVQYNDEKFREDLLSRLTGRVFHLTATRSFGKIQKDGYIGHNKSGERGLNTSSKDSFGRKNGWVCLFDLRNKSDQEISDALFKYYFLRPNWFIKYTAESTESDITYLFLNPKMHDELIPNSSAKEGSFFIPKVECWYPDNLDICHIGEALSVRISRKATDSDLYVFRQQNIRPRGIK